MNTKVDVSISSGQERTIPLGPFSRAAHRYEKPAYGFSKFLFDKTVAILSLPFTFSIALILLCVNPFLNPGPLFFKQQRMGFDGLRFEMWKFRTMSVAPNSAREYDAMLETDRITPFAHYLRKFRIDELPNFFNVLAGHMSIVGPRPDAWEHSMRYAKLVKHYESRFKVRPGITGLAQVRNGYAETMRAVERKARFDHFYVKNSGAALDTYIVLRTVVVMLTGFGAK